ncbi:hypothetical protein VF21_05251 [Pseudogymnoascus sp. 05NY08]|nr:hypothetical protein VF21_05251 [Pseudogymnoascus sp. 05NY08]
MGDTTFQRLGDLPNLDEIIAEYDNLDRELFSVNRKKARLIEERQVEDKATRHSRAHQNESIASTRQKEDSDRPLTIDELEQKNIQLTRAHEDELLASDRRKEDAGSALRRIGENKECELIKSGITQRHSELKSAIVRISRQAPGQDGQEAISKNTVSQMSEEGHLVHDKDKFVSSPPYTLVHHEQHPSRQQLQATLHRPHLQLLAQELVDASSSPSNGTDHTATKSPRPSRPVLTAIPEDSGSLNFSKGPRKRKATSPPFSEYSDSPFPAEKKRVSFGPSIDDHQRYKSRDSQRPLQPIIKKEPTSPQPCGSINRNPNQNLTPRIPTGPKLHSGTAGIKSNQQLLPGIPTGPKLHSGAAGNCNQQLVPSTPTGPKSRLRTAGVCQDDIRRLFGFAPGSGIVSLQPILIMHKSDQVHAPVAERAMGIYYTLLESGPPRREPFPVLVSTEAGGRYKYMGNYVFDGSHFLRDSEVDKLGEETCHALVTSQLMNVSKEGTSVVKREVFGTLIKKGVVRTQREATRTTALDLVKRMKHIKLTPAFTGKPVKRMDIFENRLMFKSFNEGFYNQYFGRDLA